MNGTYKRSRSYRALALAVLGGISFAATPLSALAQGAGGKGVSVTVNPTTGYAVINSNTVGTPRGTTVGPSGGPPSVTVRPAGGLSQSLPAGIEITGLRENAQTLRGPLGANINAGLGALRNAATRCLTSFRCNTAMGLGALGLQQLLDGVGWIIEEGSISRQLPIVYPPYEGQPYTISTPGTNISTWASCPTVTGSVVKEYTGTLDYAYLGGDCSKSAGRNYFLACVTSRSDAGSLSYIRPVGAPGTGDRCFYGDGAPDRETVPVTPSEIADTIDSNYNPDPSDWSWLTGGLNFSDPDVTIEITDIPVLDGSNEPNFIEWSDGTSKGTFNTYTPTVRNNNTSKPEIDVKDQQTETTYDDQGNPTGSSTSTTTTPASPSGGGAPAAEVPTDCEFMPTVCRFIDWFTEPDPSPDPDQEIRDLVQVYEDGGRTVDLGPSMGSCPPPRVIALSFVPAVEVSFQPFCDLAAAVRFWLLAIAYFGAAYLTVRSI